MRAAPESPPSPTSTPGRFAASWNDFWFTPTPTSTLALVRIAYGTVLLAWCALISFDLIAFFSDSGILPEAVNRPYAWSLLEVFSSDAALFILFGVLVVAAGCLLVGFHTRLAAAVAFVVLVSFERRNVLVLNAADILLRLFGLYLALAPAGAALSVDRWRRHRDRFWEFPARAPWALRLIQIQVSVLYLFTVWLKLRGETWHEGTAVSYSLQVTEIARFEVPAWIAQSALVSNVATYGTLAIESALALLIWNRRARPWVIAAGVALHLSVLAAIMVGLFSATVFVGYLAFAPAERASGWIAGLRRCLWRSSSPRLRRVAAAGPDPGYQLPLPLGKPSRRGNAILGNERSRTKYGGDHGLDPALPGVRLRPDVAPRGRPPPVGP